MTTKTPEHKNSKFNSGFSGYIRVPPPGAPMEPKTPEQIAAEYFSAHPSGFKGVVEDCNRELCVLALKEYGDQVRRGIDALIEDRIITIGSSDAAIALKALQTDIAALLEGEQA